MILELCSEGELKNLTYQSIKPLPLRLCLCAFALMPLPYAFAMILIEIMLQIVIAKLKDNSAMEHDRQHWKAAKALVIVIPLLGITYLFTLMGPGEEWPVFYIVFQIIRAILLSSQVPAVPFAK